MSDPTGWVAETEERRANYARTQAMLEDPSVRAERKRALDAAEAKNALALLEQPATGLMLVLLQLRSLNPVSGPLKLSEVVNELAPIVLEYGPAAFDKDKEELSLALSTAAADALQLYHTDVVVTLDVGALLQALSRHNMLENIPNVMSTCKSALIVHLTDTRVQVLYRRLMLGYGYGSLEDAHVDMVDMALATARRLMLQDAPPTSKEVLECLTHLLANALFVLMCSGQCLEYKKAVAEYVIWCLAGCTGALHGAAFYGDQSVGRQACELLFKMAAGCMQLDSEYLVEEDRQFLCSKDLTRLLSEFGNSCSDDIPHITWLLVRLGRDALFPLFSGPGVQDRKRSRGEGGAA